MNHFQGKTALITGGSSGIGLATALQLAESGANITLLARDPQKLAKACAEVRARCLSPQQKIETLTLDLTNVDHCAPALSAYCQEKGVPDYLFNFAGYAHPGEFKDLDLSIHRQTMEVNYFGTLNAIQAVVPFMIQKRSGTIVNISSIAGFLGIYGYSAYSPSKYAVRALSDVLRYELQEYGIRVSVVFPPDTQTPQLDYENQLKPEITKILDESNKVMTADAVAKSILKDTAKGKYNITPGFDSSFYFFLVNSVGGLTYFVMDRMIASARRRIQAGKNNRSH